MAGVTVALDLMCRQLGRPWGWERDALTDSFALGAPLSIITGGLVYQLDHLWRHPGQAVEHSAVEHPNVLGRDAAGADRPALARWLFTACVAALLAAGTDHLLY